MNLIFKKFKSHWHVVVVASVVVLACGGAFVFRAREYGAARQPNGQITIVSSPVEVPRPSASSTDAVIPPRIMLGATEASLLIAQHLPALHNVHSDCDEEFCTVSAEPSVALDEQAFSQLVREDMPTILARTGHGLFEPVKIEELDPDQYRLRFRIPRQAH